MIWVLLKIAYTMIDIFEQLHYQTCQEREGTKVRLLTIHNPDGSPRWICPTNSKKPYFLKFYNVTSWKAYLFVCLVKIVFLFRLQRLIFKTKTIYLRSRLLVNSINLFENNWAIFTGTIGPNRKALLYQRNNKENSFYKIALTPKAQKLMLDEAQILQKLGRNQYATFQIPHSKFICDNVLKLSDVSQDGARSTELTTTHWQAIQELYGKTESFLTLSNIQVFQKAGILLRRLCVKRDKRIPRGLLKKLMCLEKEFENNPIHVSTAHGDFTPWNTYLKHDQLAIYDWELAQKNIPVAYDVFHFIIQQEILVNHQSWKDIKAKIKKMISSDEFQIVFDEIKDNWEAYLKYYLFLHIVKYLDIYQRQPEWHVQVGWQLNTWNEALSDLLQNNENRRSLLIQDTFDFLANRQYAAIKFPDIKPETLSQYSDIDLALAQKDAKDLIHFLKNHPLTFKYTVNQKSFMSTLKILLTDGKILNLDLIWRLQRKELMLMTLEEAIKNVVCNPYGIKQMNDVTLARYISLFHTLNHQFTPTKYYNRIQFLGVGNHPIDRLLFKNFIKNQINRSRVTSILLQHPHNFILKRVLRFSSYLLDNVRQLFSSKGFIITFSGVDGAGKSTTIEEVKREIEKKYRRRVKILRHRPSLLPILSAWIKGKEQAEKEAAHMLPRQGKNKSRIGSLLRFLYYFADYFFGQFYIYFRYVSFGYVLLYDRYYFDFINDSKRSNIQISPKIAHLGYSLLLKPDYNFFLYADVETIHQRKQELDKATITQLTKNYLSLFKKLAKKQEQKYFSIENIALSKTIDFILDKTLAKI